METINKNDDNIIIPEYLESTTILRIPKKVHKSINFIPKEDLLKIHSDINVAKELCLYFLSFIIETIFDEYMDGKHLSSNKLSWLLRLSRRNAPDTSIYQNIIAALKKGTEEKGPFITVSNGYIIGQCSRKYNLTDMYKCGVQTYDVKTKEVKAMKLRNMRESLIKAQTSPIVINQIKFYEYLDLPTKEELMIKGKELCNDGYITKKGKKLTMMYRKEKSYWKDADQRSFVEKDIELYELYTSYGFMIPVVGNENCPRVFDSISLLPSWIRNEIKFDGRKLYEIDYKCMHPNLIMTIYNGKTKGITHKQVADTLNLDIKEVKTKHLSFFNLEALHMKSSKLFNYYNEIEPNVMKSVINDKYANTHKVTSKKLFTLEVDLMTNVIKKLNAEDIYVGYIYDALIAIELDIDRIIQVMNETALEMNIHTTAETNK